MSGFSSFFKSDRESDIGLILLITSFSDPTASPSKVASRKRKADAPPDTVGPETTICIPAHRVVLIAKSGYFSQRLCTAVGDIPTGTIKEHAESLDELHAMEGVLEFMYTDQLPFLCTRDEDYSNGNSGGSITLFRRHLLTLMVADRWQVTPCLIACCTALCSRPTSAMTWDDCQAVFDLPGGLREQPCLTCIGTHAFNAVLALANAASSTPPHHTLVAHLEALPISERLALLTGCKLGFTAMLVLLSSNEQVADSEDDLAQLLSSYFASDMGKACSASERKQLKGQLRHQHMSHMFVGLKLPDIPELSLSIQEASHLLYLRGLPGFESIPLFCRQPAVAAAWYKAPRKQAIIPPDSFELKLKISESALAEHLQAVALLKAGGSGVHRLTGDVVNFRGVSWRMDLDFSQTAQLWVGVRMLKTTPEGIDAACMAAVRAKLSCRLDSATPTIMEEAINWFSGRGFTNFVQRFGKLSGDPTDISWWKDYIKDGHVHFSSTVQVM